VADEVYQLVIRKGPLAGQILTLDLNRIILGRDPFSDIVIDDPEVSRYHATLILGNDGYAIQDMGSTNGTFIQDQRLGRDPVSLKDGQTIKLGTHVTIVYRKAPAADPLATMYRP